MYGIYGCGDLGDVGCSFSVLLAEISDTTFRILLDLGCHSIDLLTRFWLLHFFVQHILTFNVA